MTLAFTFLPNSGGINAMSSIGLFFWENLMQLFSLLCKNRKSSGVIC